MSETPNFYKISKERREVRKRLKEEKSSLVAEALVETIEELNVQAKEFSIAKEGGLTKAKERIGKERSEYEETKTEERWLDEKSIESEIGDIYGILSDSREKLFQTRDFEMRQLRKGIFDPEARDLNKRVLPKLLDKKASLEQSVADAREQDPLRSRAFDLVSYEKDLHREGHIAAVPSTEKEIEEIGKRMISGKPMFLPGPTGTGKTSRARFAAEHFTGQKAEMVYCNPQTRESNIWGKTGIRPAEGEAGQRGAIETVDIYGPLARAMRDGKVVIFDEFTALPKEQMVFFKGIFNAKVGDTVNVMGNGVVEIAPGFQMIFTANLKSEKNPERQELPPEIAREFEQNNLEVGYTPPDEAYDIMLARLMDKDGSVTLSRFDLTDTLPRFAKAMAEVQTAFTDKESDATARLTQTMGTGGRLPGLKKLVFTQGTVENILDAWKIDKQTNPKSPSFVEFLDRRLAIALTFKEYPESDRILAAKILASQGLLRTVTPKELGLSADVFNFDAANRLRQDKNAVEELVNKSSEEERVSILELADLDPFNKKQEAAASAAAGFLPPDAKPDVVFGAIPPPETIKENLGGFLKRSYKESWSGSDQIVAGAGEKPEMKNPLEIDWQTAAGDIDASKFGEFTINPDTVGIKWETIPPEKIKVFAFEDFRGKKRWELAKYITTQWPDRDKYHIPGIEYWKYIFENPDKAPDSLKDGNWHFLFGSVFRGSNGRWNVPLAIWVGSASKFERSGHWLTLDWTSDDRVVLLEK